MIDLETWGLGAFSVITQIGAVVFNPKAPLGSAGEYADIEHSFEVSVNPIDAQAKGLRVEAETVAWWMNPERDEPRELWLKTIKFDLALALDGFDMWLTEIGIPKDERVIWGNGSDFDNVLLGQAYKVMNREVPWHYFNNRCFRTLKSLDSEGKFKPEFIGVKHTAVCDARHEAKWACEIARQFELNI